MKFGLKREKKETTDKVIVPQVKQEVIQIEEIIINDISLKDKALTKDDLWDYIRVVNVRGDPEYQPNEDEKVIAAHRDNPTLGNKHPALVHTIEERSRVIAACKCDVEHDIEQEGPIYQTLYKIALDIIENKQKVALACWCMPRNCHAEIYVPIIVELGSQILDERNQLDNEIKPPKKKF